MEQLKQMVTSILNVATPSKFYSRLQTQFDFNLDTTGFNIWKQVFERPKRRKSVIVKVRGSSFFFLVFISCGRIDQNL